MNLNKHDQKFKEALALEKERNKILKQIWAIEPIKLEKPIHHGYVKYLEFNKETKLAYFYTKVKRAFDLVGQKKVYCKDKNFVDKKGGKLTPYLKSIKAPRFSFYHSEEERSKKQEEINNCGNYLRLISDEYSCHCYKVYRNEKFIPHYELCPYQKTHLEEKIDDHWLTHYTPKDGELEGRLKEIDQIFEQKQYLKLLYNCKYDRDYYGQWSNVKAEAHGVYHEWPRPVWSYDNAEYN